MQIILLQDIKNIGRKGEIKQVADGHALNFLIPQKKAIPATADKIKAVTEHQNKILREQTKNKNLLENIIKKISGQKIVLTKKASDKGKLFAAISVEDIALALQNKFSLKIKANEIKLKEHLKEIGEHKIEIEIEHKKVNIAIEVISNG